MLSSPSKRPTFYQIREGIRQRRFFILKILQLFYQKVTGGLLYYYGIVFKEEKKDLVKSKFEGIIFYIKSVVKRKFQRPRYFQIHIED